MKFYYVWIIGDNTRTAVSIYNSLQNAINIAVQYENIGHDVQVRNAETGELCYE